MTHAAPPAHRPAGSSGDAAGTEHGVILTGGAFHGVDVAGATSTRLTRITDNGLVPGSYTDAVNGVHGLIGR